MFLRFSKYFLAFAVLVTALLIAYIYFDRPQVHAPKKEDTAQIVLNDDIDWDSTEIELTSILTDLIQIPTVNKDEVKAALYFQKILQKEGIQAKLIPNPDRPDKVSVIAEIGPEESEGGIILLNHLDVVGADPKEWSVDPFKAIMQDNKIYGRGAMDMKGMGAMELEAFLLINREQIPLKSKIMFLAVPDEETGGKYGVQFLLEKHEDLFDGYDYVINEGGFGIQDFPHKGNKIFNVQTAEKGILGVELAAHSDSGHGSMPEKKYSSLNITRTVLDLQSLQKFKLTPVTSEFFHYLAQFYKFPENFLLERIQNPIIQKIIGPKIAENKAMNAMVTNTISVTELGTKTLGPNVIPAEANAYLDIRLLPNESPTRMFEQIKKVASQYNVTAIEKESFPSTQSTPETQLYDVLYTVLQDNVPDVLVTQYLSPGATDNRFFRQRGFQCYGLIPIMITMNDVSMLHGKDEYISLKNLQLGTKILYETLIGYNQVIDD